MCFYRVKIFANEKEDNLLCDILLKNVLNFTIMEKSKLYKAIYYSNGIILLLVIAFSVMGIFAYPISPVLANRISLFLVCILFVIDFLLYRLVKWLLKYFGHKEKCNFVSTNTCPYGSKDDCPYDVTACYAYQDVTPTPKKVYSICFLLVVSIVISITAELLKDDGQLIDFMSNKYSLQTIAKMLQPIAQSVIAAIIISFIIDIPERMKEYKGFFIDILTSFDYLKNMNEEQLTNLRKRVTWQLHVKDFPHMAEGLIDLDERFCKMLKQPYFSEYSQIVNVHAIEKKETPDKDGENNIDLSDCFVKSYKSEYIAVNPSHENMPINMNIGQSSAVKFHDESNFVNESQAIFKVKKFTIIFDDDSKEYDLTKYIDIAVTEKAMDGLIYNGIVSIVPQNQIGKKNNPFSPSCLSKNISENSKGIQYKKLSKDSDDGLYATFKKKIQVKLEYDLAVPKDDVSYTKRLKYPVKLFNIDYSLNELPDYTVVGQLIGTLMDQPDVTIDLSEDKKRVTLRTHNWLLPKNGAVIVHCKK